MHDSRIRKQFLLSLVVAFAWFAPVHAQSDSGENESLPMKVDLEEKIEVQLVLVDVTVIDARGRTVPGLSVEDFKVKAGGRRVEIASLDASCPDGALDDVAPLRKDTEPNARSPFVSAPEVTELAKRFVLVFDYFHINSASDTLESATEATTRAQGGEHMVISLGGNGLRVEQPFTSDQAEVRATLERMRNDPALYAGAHGRLTERRFFDRIRKLLGLLETIPGRKAVVLYSGSFIADGFTYDPVFKELAALAARARSSIYTVDSEGLRTMGMADSGIGGPLMLRRLSNETGGRPTANTNDLSMGYARAQRDLACAYTLGFVDRSPTPNRNRKLSIKVLRDGHRAIYPEAYVVRTKQRKRRALVEAAAALPEMFESPAVKVDIFLMPPHSPRKWEAIVAARLQPEAGRAPLDEPDWDLRGILRLPSGAPIHRFKHSVRIDPTQGATHFESLRVRPGRYLMSLVLSHPRVDQPLAATVELELPEIPRGDPFLVGPLLGRRVDEFSLHGLTIEPLIGQEVTEDELIASQTWLCRIGSGRQPSRGAVRRLLTSGSEAVKSYDAIPFDLAGKGSLHCHGMLDSLPSPLVPGEYDMLALSQKGDNTVVSRKATFTVLPLR